MRMSRVAGDEDPAGLVSLGHRDLEIPEADIVEIAGDRETGSAVLRYCDLDMIALLLDRFGGPAEPDLDIVEFFKPCAQDVFSLILRQTLVVLEIIRIDDLAQRRRRPIFIVQIAVSDDPAHGVIGRQDACGAQRVHNAPEIEVLDRTLCEILPLRNALRFAPALDERAGNTALAELDCERHADRSAADDDDLTSLGHYCRSSKIGSADSGTRCQVLGSVSSNCQLCPRADSSTSSPWSMRQA